MNQIQPFGHDVLYLSKWGLGRKTPFQIPREGEQLLQIFRL